MHILESSEKRKKDTPCEMYPRVLVISKRRITERDNSGASIGKWFGGWPRDKVAHIFSGGPSDTHSFFAKEYLFAGHDRRFGKVFDRLKRSSLGDYVRPQLVGQSVGVRGKEPTRVRIKQWLSKTLVASGLWELLFPPTASPELLSWVQEFQPEVIYTTASDLSFMRLSLMLHAFMKIPICMQMSDDFPRMLYGESPLGIFMRPIIEQTFAKLIKASSIRLGTGEIMEREYKKRYGAEFTPLMICDEPARYREAIPHRAADSDVISIIYSGELFLDRWRSLADVAEACQKLAEEGNRIRIDAFVPNLPSKAENVLKRYSTVFLHDALRDAEVPSTFKGADILLLPESFNQEVTRNIRLSISSKSHLYMMSERPILVYGPAGIGVVEYARSAGWGFAVADRDIGKLQEAICRLVFDKKLIEQLLRQSRFVFLTNHDASVVRENFRMALLSAVHQWESNGSGLKNTKLSNKIS